MAPARKRSTTGERRRGLGFVLVPMKGVAVGRPLEWATLEEPPIHDVHLAKLTDHDVLRLEVAVQHATGMREGNRFANAQKSLEERRKWLGLGRAPPHLVQDLFEGDASYELHGEVQTPVG